MFDKNGTPITVDSVVSWTYGASTYMQFEGVKIEGPVKKISVKKGRDGLPLYRVTCHAQYDYEVEFFIGGGKHKRVEKGTTFSSFASKDGVFKTLEVVS